MNTYFIADLHFFDNNIINIEGRPFDNYMTMNETIIYNWNSVVADDDIVYLLGDVAHEYSDSESLKTTLKRLNGKIVLIAGNHDLPWLSTYRELGIEVITYPIILDNYWILSHEPVYVTERAPYANIFGHVHMNPIYNTVSKRSYCVSAERTNYVPLSFEYIKGEIASYGIQTAKPAEIGI